MIGIDALVELLVACDVESCTDGPLTADSPVVIDSFTLVWLTHRLAERYGVSVDPTPEELAELVTVRAVHRYLGRVWPAARVS